MAEEFRVLRPYEYHSQLTSKGIRADGRNLNETREVKLETDAIRTADSSSLVKLGNTSLVCGCTSQIVSFEDKNSDIEEIKIKVELPPICSSPTGYRSHNAAQLLAKTLKDILENTSCINKENLFISESRYWSVDVEVICLNYDGSLLDAALIAILSALNSLDLKDTNNENQSKRIIFDTIPFSLTSAIIGDQLVSDPNLEEETVAQSVFSIVADSKLHKFSVLKSGGKSISVTELQTYQELALARADQLRSLVFTRKDEKVQMDAI